MINKENINIEPDANPEPKKDDGFLDIAKMDINCHLLIKDKDTGEMLVNKRG